MLGTRKKLILLIDDPSQIEVWRSVRFIQSQLRAKLSELHEFDTEIIPITSQQTELFNFPKFTDPIIICHACYLNNLKNIFQNHPILLAPGNSHNIWSFGNITHQPHKWLERLNSLEGKNVRFIGASRAATIQIQKIFERADSTTIPYPVSTPLTQTIRQYSPFTFAYGGRLVKSKGIDILIKTFLKLSKEYPEIQLKIFGEAHFQNHPLHGITQIPSVMTKAMKQVLAKSKNIEWQTDLDISQFEESLRNVDCYVSLSTYHDEDFGISLKQAYYSGNRLIGTYWGGQKDTLNLQQDSLKIPVILNENNLIPTIDEDILYRSLEKAFLERHKQRKKVFDDREENKDRLINLLNERPASLYIGDDFRRYVQHFEKNHSIPFKKSDSDSRHFYIKHYSSYLSKEP